MWLRRSISLHYSWIVFHCFVRPFLTWKKYYLPWTWVITKLFKIHCYISFSTPCWNVSVYSCINFSIKIKMSFYDHNMIKRDWWQVYFLLLLHLHLSVSLCRFRNTEPVCAGVQAQILSCYRDNRDQTLKCSDLAKEYMKCIDAAKKVRAETTNLKGNKIKRVKVSEKIEDHNLWLLPRFHLCHIKMQSCCQNLSAKLWKLIDNNSTNNDINNPVLYFTWPLKDLTFHFEWRRLKFSTERCAVIFKAALCMM